jgi:eukaryotic-like serine/threonine-protein kinase
MHPSGRPADPMDVPPTQSERLTAALAGRYGVVREIGRGGMATVYLAEDPRHRRQVAIKVFNAELAEAQGRERFLREIEVTAGLTHPHILPLYDSGVADGLGYYVMPFVEGNTLRPSWRRGGRFRWTRRCAS